MQTGQLIRSLRESKKLTQEQLAKMVGVSRVSISKWESGENKPKGDNLLSLASALGVSIDWLMSGNSAADAENKTTSQGSGDFSNISIATLGAHRVPVLSYVQAGSFQPCADRLGEGIYEYVTTDLDAKSNAFAVWVKGNSMEPEFCEGDLIIVDPDAVPSPGDFVVAKNGSEEATFKKYRPRGYKEDGSEIFELVPLNDDYPKLSSETCVITIIGKVIEHRKFFKRRR